MKRSSMPMVVALLLSVGSARAACTDPGAVTSVRATADQQCPCESASGHKAYVRCVAGVAKTAAKSGALPKQCRAQVVRCAKQSTCGRPGFVTCCRTAATGSTKCLLKPNEAKCTAPKGGSACAGAVPSCCDSCSAGSCTGATTTTTPVAPTAPPGPTTTLAAGTHTVMVGSGGAFAFTPASLTIQVGETVR